MMLLQFFKIHFISHFQLLRSLDLYEDLEPEYSEKYLRPVYYQAQLPLGHHMAKAILPKRYIANHLDNTYLLTLVTYDGNFSRVRINEHGIVVEITCVTKKVSIKAFKAEKLFLNIFLVYFISF